MEIKKKVNEVKEKAKEQKDKVIRWSCDHIDDIVAYGSLAIFGSLTGLLGYVFGRGTGYSEGFDFVPNQFGVDSYDDLVRCRNTETGNLDYLMTKEFEDLMFENSDTIHYKDGSWSFKSEVK